MVNIQDAKNPNQPRLVKPKCWLLKTLVGNRMLKNSQPFLLFSLVGQKPMLTLVLDGYYTLWPSPWSLVKPQFWLNKLQFTFAHWLNHNWICYCYYHGQWLNHTFGWINHYLFLQFWLFQSLVVLVIRRLPMGSSCALLGGVLENDAARGRDLSIVQTCSNGWLMIIGDYTKQSQQTT